MKYFRPFTSAIILSSCIGSIQAAPADPPAIKAIRKLGGRPGLLDYVHTNFAAADNTKFRDAIETWNAHRWQESDGKFKQYLTRHPKGAWSGEALLHIGCLASYQKDFKEAKKRFNTVVSKWPKTQIARKARLRLSNLYFKTRELDKALAELEAVLKESPTWRQVTYAKAFKHRVLLHKIAAANAKKTASRDCGIRSLAFCLKRKGQGKIAQMLTTQERTLPRDTSLLDLKTLAQEYELNAWGVEAERSAAAKLPTPFIAHFDYPDHFLVVDQVEGGKVRAVDPDEGRRVYASDVFARLWSGKALLFAKTDLAGLRLLGQAELAKTTGGCCGTYESGGMEGCGGCEGCVPDTGPPPPADGDPGPEDPMPPDVPGPPPGVPDPPAGPGDESDCSLGLDQSCHCGIGYVCEDEPVNSDGHPLGPTNPADCPIPMQGDGVACYGTASATGGCSFGMPKASFNTVSASVGLKDTPLYYRCEIGPSVAVTLFYSGDNSGTGSPVGPKWKLNYHSYYTVEPGEDDVIVTRLSGREHTFINDGNDNFTPPDRVRDTLVKNQDGTYTLTLASVKYEFHYSADNQMITSIENRWGKALTFSYDANDKLTKLTDASSRGTTLLYDSNDQITKITTPFSQTTILYYDGSDRLTKVTDMAGDSSTFFYDHINRITKFTTPKGTTTYNYLGETENGDTYGWLEKGEGAPPVPRYIEATERTDADGRLRAYLWSAWDRGYSEIRDAGITTPVIYNTTATEPAKAECATGVQVSDDDNADWLIKYAYGPYGLRTKITVGNGSEAVSYRLLYDANRRITKTIDPFGQATTYAYDNNGNGTKATGPKGNSVTYYYDANNALTRTVGSGGTFLYDGNGKFTSLTNSLGKTATYALDSYSRRTKTTYADSTTETYAYSPVGLVTAITDANSNTTTFLHDALGRITRTTYADASYETKTYACCGATETRDANGNVTTYAYDGTGHLTKRALPNGSTYVSLYDGSYRRTKTTDAEGRSTTYAYSDLNQLTKTTYPDGATSTYYYDSRGNRTKVVDPNGNATTFLVGKTDQPYKTIDALGNERHHWPYDPNGNRLQQRDARGNYTYFEYDDHNRLIQTTDALNNVTRIYYDAAGQRTKTLDQTGEATTYHYDDVGRLTKTVYSDSGTSISYYDDVGNVTKSSDQDDNDTTYYYNLRYRVTKITDPWGKNTTFVYDSNGNTLTRADPNGEIAASFYDTLNRVTKVTGNAGNSTVTLYDKVGNRTKVTDAESKSSVYLYDTRNRVTKVTDPESRSTVFLYDLAGNRTKLTDAEGNSTTFHYDELSRMTKLEHADGQSITYAYNENGAVKSKTDGNSKTIHYIHDALNRLAEIHEE